MSAATRERVAAERVAAGRVARGRVAGWVDHLRSLLETLARDGDPGWAEAFEALGHIESAVDLLEDVAQDSFGAFEQGVRQLSLLRAVQELVVESFDRERLCRGFLELLDRELPCAASALDVEAGDTPRIVQGDWDAGLDGPLADACRSLVWEEGLLNPGRPLEHPGLGRLAEAAKRSSLLVSPVEVLGRPYGVLHRFDSEPEHFAGETARVTRAVCNLLGLALRHVALSEDQAACGRIAEPRMDSALLSLARREKFFALDRLAASVAHELNNPMSYVLSNVARAREYLDALADRMQPRDAGPADARSTGDLGELVADFRSLLDETAEGLARMRTVAKRLHDVGGHSSKPEAPVDLNEIVEIALGMARSDTKSTIRFDLALKPLPEVVGRRFDLVHAVFNLLSNAIEAVDSDGEVRVGTFRVGPWVRVEVADDGDAPEVADTERLFEPFHTSKPEPHAGLGLPIARGIARAHGGDVSLVLGGESVATLSLPVAEARRTPR